MVGFSSAVFVLLLTQGWDPASAAALTLILCLLFGGVNALAIVWFEADAIAATLGMLTALRGLTWVLVGATGSIFAFHPGLFMLTNLSVAGLPLLFVVSLGLSAVAAVVVTRTRVGRHVQAVGGDAKAAGRAGIRVGRVRTAALLASAFGGGLGGILYVAQLGSAARATGFGLEFQFYAALMIGGYSILRGGVGNPIAEQTGETVNVNALGNLTGMCIDKVRGKEGIQLDLLIGSRGPLYCGGAGKAMLAWLSSEDQARVFDMPMEPLTVHTIIDPEVLRQEVERIRRRGYSLDEQEVVMGVYCVVVPIFDRHNRPVGAISITGPSVKRPGPELQPLVDLLNDVCGHVSRRLGYGGVWPPGER